MHSCLHVPDLTALRHLTFKPRRATVGHYAGRHASAQRGRSVEFLDYRDYTPGDSPGDLDWKVFARRDKLFVKRYQQQADLSTTLLVDASASMAYAGLQPSGPVTKPKARLKPAPGEALRRRAGSTAPNASKFIYAAQLAAGFAYLITAQQDHVGLAFAQRGLLTHLPARPTFPHLRRVVSLLDETSPKHDAQLAEALRRLADQRPRRGPLLVISDMHEEPGPILDALSRFIHKGHEVSVLHLLHRDELDLPDLDDVVFVDSETSRELRVNVRDLRTKYATQINARIDHWRRHLLARGIDHHVVSTATPYIETLRQHLHLRNM